ncbi:hypothetical protein AVEN_93795-1 [Araneus ventricosus]|uniref:RNA-directed DNA polymerase n=1 Tax=Araneus ventricosus TaxID=182803 RepID=A0A4Y2A6Z5_ARAVE|nr:hypothetical protein AVEN_75939-1 [Araneus ventricosus]GBL75618.1 hypothetical protein AVEN_93795-1 [Araneus ventricosus]
MDFSTPKTKTQIRAFLGLAGYHAHYVKNFSLIAAPLTQSLKGKIKKEGVNWTRDCNRAFTELKNRLTEIPVLHGPDYNKEFIVQTDASDLAIGVGLSAK